MTVSLRGNGIAGTMTFAEAEEQCEWLVATGRTIPSDQWIPAMAERRARVANGQWLANFMG